MIFAIFIYIMGTLIALNGFRLSYKGGTLYPQMSQMQRLSVLGNRIIGSVHMCAGMIIITVMAKG